MISRIFKKEQRGKLALLVVITVTVVLVPPGTSNAGSDIRPLKDSVRIFQVKTMLNWDLVQERLKNDSSFLNKKP